VQAIRAQLPPPSRLLVPLGLLLLALLAGGCANTTTFQGAQGQVRQGADQTVLLMPRDVELSLLTTGGLHEPNAAWTDTARRNVDAALGQVYEQDGARLEDHPAHVQLVKLHQAVGQSILLHKFQPGFQLPVKGERFDWSLGEDSRALKQAYGADYALFVHFRDSFSSGGRVAAKVLLALLVGAHIQGGQQAGFASLVDLDSGRIVWFNRLVSGAGDLREPDSARAATESLLTDLPI